MIDSINAAIVARWKKGRPDADTLAKVKELDGEFQTAWTAKNVLYTEAAAKTAYIRQTPVHGRKLSKGENSLRSYSLHDFQEDYKAKQDAAQHVMLEISCEAAAIARPICERYAELCRSVAQEVEAAEEKSFGEFGQPYVPSQLIHALRRQADTARARMPSVAGAAVRPAHMVPIIDLD